MTLVKPIEFAEQLQRSRDIFAVQAHIYRKKHGQYPPWFIHSPKRGPTRIDYDMYINLLEIPRDVFLYSSGTLYWILQATNHSNSDMARLMVNKSKYFKSETAWNMFISKRLFEDKPNVRTIVKPTMATEFLRIGTKHLYLLRKWNKLDLQKEKDYYES